MGDTKYHCRAPITLGLIALLGLSACVGGTGLPSQGVTNLLSSTTAEEPNSGQQAASPESQLTVAGAPTPSPEKAQTAGQTSSNALVPTNTKKEPAQTAVAAVVAESKPGAPQASTPAKAAEAPTQAKQEAKPIETQLVPATPKTAPTEKKSSGFFDSLFASNTNKSKRSAPTTREQEENGAVVRRTSAPVRRTEVTSQSASTSKPTQPKEVQVTSSKRNTKSTGGGLPGVSLKKLFGFGNDVEELDEPVKVAAVANLARRGTHGLLLQRPDVKVGCFPKPLISILRKVERRFGRTPIVTSGYRSPAHNRRIRGARNSTHIRCLAADIQVKGVSKWRLAKYVRSIPGRGGVGTYCHTNSVHIDIANKRDWNVRCRRKRRR